MLFFVLAGTTISFIIFILTIYVLCLCSNFDPLLFPSILKKKLLLESSVTTRLQPRSRDEKKVTDTTKQKNVASEESMDTSKGNADDVYEFKSVKESDSSLDHKSTELLETEAEDVDPLNVQTSQSDEGSKRNFSDMADSHEETGNDDESRRKKRKDESGKDSKVATQQRSTGQGKTQTGKLSTGVQGKLGNAGTTKGNSEKKSPCTSPKPGSISEGEIEDGKSDLKVPPLKIVIPQSSTSEQESGQSRNGKNSSQRSQALPYVVPSSNSSDNSEKDNSGGTTSPTESVGKAEDKKDTSGNSGDDQVGLIIILACLLPYLLITVLIAPRQR